MSQRAVQLCDGCEAELPQPPGPLGQPTPNFFGPPGWAKLTISQPTPDSMIATYDLCPRCTARVITMFELPPPDPVPQPPWLKPVG